MYVAKKKVLISFAVTAKLICVFIFAYAESPFSHDAAHRKNEKLNQNFPSLSIGSWCVHFHF